MLLQSFYVASTSIQRRSDALCTGWSHA